MVGFDNRPDLEPGGQRGSRDGLRQRPDHHEAIADAPIALALDQRDAVDDVRVDPRPQLVRLVARPLPRGLPAAPLGPAHQRRPDAVATSVGMDEAHDLVDRDPVAHSDANLDLAHDRAIDLGDDEVPAQIEVRLVLEVVPDVLLGQRELHPVGDRAVVDQRGEAGQVAVEVGPPEPEAPDRRSVRDLDLGSGARLARRCHRHASTGTSSGLRQAVLLRTRWNPQLSYRCNAALGFSESTPRFALVMPRSRSTARLRRTIARPSPRCRYGRRTKTESSMPRRRSKRLFSSSSMTLRTAPAISSPANATT